MAFCFKVVSWTSYLFVFSTTGLVQDTGRICTTGHGTHVVGILLQMRVGCCY